MAPDSQRLAVPSMSAGCQADNNNEENEEQMFHGSLGHAGRRRKLAGF
jgi:hypothetical protein